MADRLGVIVRGQEAELRYVVQIDAHQPQHVLEQVARCAHGGEPLARRGGAADDRVQILVRGQLRGKVFGREGFRVHLGVGVVVVNHPQRQAFRGNARRVLLRFHAQAQRRRHVVPAQAAGNHHAHRSRPPLLRGDEAGFLIDGDHGVVARRFPAQRRGDAAVARVLHAHLVAIGVNPMHARVQLAAQHAVAVRRQLQQLAHRVAIVVDSFKQCPVLAEDIDGRDVFALLPVEGDLNRRGGLAVFLGLGDRRGDGNRAVALRRDQAARQIDRRHARVARREVQRERPELRVSAGRLQKLARSGVVQIPAVELHELAFARHGDGRDVPALADELLGVVAVFGGPLQHQLGHLDGLGRRVAARIAVGVGRAAARIAAIRAAAGITAGRIALGLPGRRIRALGRQRHPCARRRAAQNQHRAQQHHQNAAHRARPHIRRIVAAHALSHPHPHLAFRLFAPLRTFAPS